MSVTDSSPDQSQTETVRCKRCHAVLPPTAAFCGQCGERVEKSSGEHVSPRRADITDRYRITSLLRRQPPAQLLLALDTQQQRPVVIHDIDISSLAEPEHTQVVDALQQEYDLLRQQRIPAIMPLVELRHHNGHLYVISGWPFALRKPEQTPSSSSSTRISHTAAHQLSTLQDLLQSGLGLPEPEIALQWIYRLSRALEQLHRQEIPIGNIDPQSILISQHDYSGEPVLVVSWLPDLLYKLLPPSNQNNASPFRAPETLQGVIEPHSDIYSLGAILYLLLTGIPPYNAQERIHKTLPSLLELDPPNNAEFNVITMQALALEPEQRFARASDFSDALAALLPKSRTGLASNPGIPGKGKTEINIASTSVDNKTNIANRAHKAGKSDTSDGPDDTTFMEEPEDVTISIVPLQAQMARRYLSRIKTGKLDINEQSTGEAPVEEGSNTQYPTFKHTKDKNRQTGQAKREAALSTQPYPEEKQTSSAYTDDIAQHETILIKTDDVKFATAVIGEASNQTRQTRSTTVPAPVSLQAQTRSEEQKKETEQTASAQTANSQEQNEPQESPQKDFSLARFKALITGSIPAIPRLLQQKETAVVEQAATKQAQHTQTEDEESLLKRVQRMLLGEHPQSTSAAALIETPMRVQPHQNYIMRINIIGRSTQNINESGGLSALCEGETIHIEVRSALYQNYAYIVQQANVQIPADGYVAEVAMPMQPLGSGPSGRRERLHVFFMDAERNPLYEKPFVLELFISHLVHRGREGHNVLSIPL